MGLGVRADLVTGFPELTHLVPCHPHRLDLLFRVPPRNVVSPNPFSGDKEARSQPVLLEYWLSPGQSYLWVIGPQAIRFHVLPPAGSRNGTDRSSRISSSRR